MEQEQALDVQALSQRISELETLLHETNNSTAWATIKAELHSKMASLDSSWQFSDGDDLQRCKIIKLGLIEVVNIEDEWAMELSKLKQDIEELESPDLVQSGDFDNE